MLPGAYKNSTKAAFRKIQLRKFYATVFEEDKPQIFNCAAGENNRITCNKFWDSGKIWTKNPVRAWSWKDSFAIAINSDITGMTIASPKYGKIFLAADKLDENFKRNRNIINGTSY